MSTLVGYAALACVAAGVLAGVLVLAVTRDGRLALRVALDLWLAAGLLRLAQPPGWDQLLSAAAIIAVRQLVGLGLRADPERAGPGPLSPSGTGS